MVFLQLIIHTTGRIGVKELNLLKGIACSSKNHVFHNVESRMCYTLKNKQATLNIPLTERICSFNTKESEVRSINKDMFTVRLTLLTNAKVMAFKFWMNTMTKAQASLRWHTFIKMFQNRASFVNYKNELIITVTGSRSRQHRSWYSQTPVLDQLSYWSCLVCGANACVFICMYILVREMSL